MNFAARLELMTCILSFVLAGCGGSLAWHPSCTPLNSTLLSFWNADLIMGPITFDQIHALSGNNGTMTSGITIGTSPVGNSYIFNQNNDQIKIASSLDLSTYNAFTLSAWVKSRAAGPSPLSIQTIVTNGGTQPRIDIPSLWTSVDISSSSILNNSNYRAYQGSIFDGRYIYFMPKNGYLPRYDTQGNLAAATSWSGVSLTSMLGAGYTSFNGGAFDGRYIYLTPYGGSASMAARYDTQGTLSSAASWQGVDLTNVTGNANAVNYEGSYFDGRYVYYVSNKSATTTNLFLRFDTQQQFQSSAAWQAFDLANFLGGLARFSGGAFDGRFLYLVQYGTSPPFYNVVRYDTTQPFLLASSYLSFDLSTVSTNLYGMGGALFDGRYIYVLPVYNTAVSGLFARYDTHLTFNDQNSWTQFDINTVSSLGSAYTGIKGGTFDGRYFYFGAFFSGVARYDSTGDFTSQAGWSGVDLSTSSGLSNSALTQLGSEIFDGRHIYFATTNTGNIARYDTLGTTGSYNFRATTIRANAGGNSLPGPSFVISSGSQALNISTQELQTSFSTNTWYHLAVSYDGLTMKMYMNGVLNQTVSAPGALNSATANMILGSTPSGLNTLLGELSQIQVYNSALSSTDILRIYNTKAQAFCH